MTPRTRKRILLLIVFPLGIFVLFLPQLGSIASGLYYGRRVAFGDWTVPAPYPWFVYERGETLAMGRSTSLLTHLFLRDLEILIFRTDSRIGVDVGNPEELASWKEVVTNQERPNALRILPEREFTVGGSPGVCLGFETSPSAIRIRCIVPQESLLVTFEGGAEAESDFTTLVEGIQRHPGSSMAP